MIDRRKTAVLLLVLGAGLAVVASFQDIYRTLHRSIAPEQTLTTTLWIVTSDPPHGPEQDAYYAVGWPVVIAALLMIVAAVLMLKERTGHVAKAVAMGASGALAGIVLAYWLQVRHEEAMMAAWPIPESERPVLDVLSGMYLLMAGAAVGLVGAALAQQKQKEQPEEQEEVVVHQLADDDTPPFGIAIPHEEQETR